MNPGSALTSLTGNPPLLRRLSQHFFHATDSESSLPLPPMPTKSTASLSRHNSSLSTKPRMEEETPERYVQRLEGAVAKAEIASVLASR